ncbi:MAG: ABC transporter ATP-binding protein [Candidatus Binatia bacterium]
MMLRVKNLIKDFAGGVQAVKGISFEVGEGEFYTLLGPSGCGKTTTLRSIAGLETPDGGEISIGDTKVFSKEEGILVPVHHRAIGMVFQSYAIWPHLTVFNNVAFPLKHSSRGGIPKSEIREKVLKALSLVQLDGLADRPAPFLSGGQQQRVALARALIYEPKLLLLDEPLSNLDAKLREEMRVELKLLVGRLGITTLYVTHDQAEALALSDQVAVMNLGVIIQEGTPRQIYLEPKDAFTANFIGKTNIFHGTVSLSSSPDGQGVDLSVGRLACLLPRGLKAKEQVQVLIRPEGIQIFEAKPQATNNVIPGEIVLETFQGDSVEYQIRVGDQECRVKSDAIRAFGKQRQVFLHLPPERCLVIEKQAALTTNSP